MHHKINQLWKLFKWPPEQTFHGYNSIYAVQTNPPNKSLRNETGKQISAIEFKVSHSVRRSHFTTRSTTMGGKETNHSSPVQYNQWLYFEKLGTLLENMNGQTERKTQSYFLKENYDSQSAEDA